MDENEMYLKISEKIDKLIDKLDNKFDLVEDKLQNHEVRIVVLEQKAPETKVDFKTEIVNWLVKGLVISVVVIGTMAGAGSMIKGLFGL